MRGLGHRVRLIAIVLVCARGVTSGQGTFQNLGFEAVNISPLNQTGFFPFNDVFPAWVGYIGTNQTPQAFYNSISFGAALSSIIGPYTSTLGLSNYVISGQFTAVIAAGEDQILNDSHEIVSAAIGQSGTVPLTAKSLTFRIGPVSRVSDLHVTFNGFEIPIYLLASQTNFDLYGGDISAFAGATGELRFTSRPLSSPLSKNYLDDVSFSNQTIPEPGVVGWVVLGAVLYVWRRAHGLWRVKT